MTEELNEISRMKVIGIGVVIIGVIIGIRYLVLK
jgi:hypothetical protein